MRKTSQRADPQWQPLPFIKPLPAMGTRMIRKSFYLQQRASDKGRPSQLLPLVPASPPRRAHRQPQHHENYLSPESNYYPLQTASAQQLTPQRAALLQPLHPCEGGTRPSGCSPQTETGKQTLQLRFNCAPACLTPISLSHGKSTVQLLPLQCSTVLLLQSLENSPPLTTSVVGGLAESPGITMSV